MIFGADNINYCHIREISILYCSHETQNEYCNVAFVGAFPRLQKRMEGVERKRLARGLKIADMGTLCILEFKRTLEL